MSSEEASSSSVETRIVRSLRRVDGGGLPFIPFGLFPLIGLGLLAALVPFLVASASSGRGATAPAAAPGAAVDLQRPDWAFELNQGVLRLAGDVPDQASRESLVAAAKLAIRPPGVLSVEDALTVTDQPAPNGAMAIALRGVNTLGRCTGGRAAFQEGAFELDCDAAEARAGDVQALATAPLPYGTLGSVSVRAIAPDIPAGEIEACETSLADLLQGARIQFDVASPIIREASTQTLDQVAEAARACPGRLRIEGHTDDTGLAELNDDLSRQRAEAVRAALISRGVAPARLIAEGFGSREPIASNETEAGRARNRRIEIEVVRVQP
ncbi:MAG: OmpA family protein [Pseudomonadota bacterium]